MFETSYWIWEGILSKELCDAIILESDKLNYGEGLIGGGYHPSAYNKEIRNTNIAFFERFHWIEGICLNYAAAANLSSGWNFELSCPESVQYAKYFPDQHYIPHRDSIIRNDNNDMRKISVSIQISDPNDYEGGDLIIGHEDSNEYVAIDQFKKRGSVIVFPSIVKHGIMPVTRGVRHSAVCWIHGPKFR